MKLELSNLPALEAVGVLGGSAADSGIVFTQFAIDAGAAEVWRLVDMTSTPIIASVNTARNGTATAFDLTAPEAVLGPISGETKLAPYLDGSTSYGDILTAGYSSLFNKDEGGIFQFVKVDAAAWAATTQRYMTYVRVDATNFIEIAKGSSVNQLRFSYVAGGTSSQVLHAPISTTAWISVAITWSASNDRMRAFVNGAQVGVDQTGLGTFSAGALNRAIIGAISTVPVSVHLGNAAYSMLFNAEPSTTTIKNIHNAA